MSAKKKTPALTLIAPLLEDPRVTELMIDGTAGITVEKHGRIEDTGLRYQTNDEIKNLIQEILKMAGGGMEEGRTVYEVRLKDNSRMTAILSPTAINGHCVVFRKQMSNQVTWEKLFEYRAATPEVRDLFQSAIQSHVGILIAGGTASGKTTLANRVIELIPPEERIVAAEAAHQYQFTHPRAVLLEAQGTPQMTLNDLLTAASKMRPDWLVVGELEGAEALRAMQLFSTGYSGLTVIHADNAANALTRLETLCLMANLGLGMDDIRQIIVSGLRLVSYQERLTNGQRKVLQLVELKGIENGRYILQPLMRYDPGTDQFEFTGVKAGWQK